jgi:DDE superfamily endonuclease
MEKGVVSVSSLRADEDVSYPLDVEPYTPESYCAPGKNDPAFRTKPQIALQLVQRAKEQEWQFRAAVADSLSGEDRGLRTGLRQLQIPYVLALNPAHAWWHPTGVAGTVREVAHEAGWVSTQQPGRWVQLTRTFRDGSEQGWWAVELVAGPYGPGKAERAVVATTDPATVPDLPTCYLVTNLPASTASAENGSPLLSASLEQIVRLYGLRTRVEQNYKHVTHALGCSQYQVRSDKAIRRQWQLVCCAFCFCWHDVSPSRGPAAEASSQPPEAEGFLDPERSVEDAGTRKKNQPRRRQAVPDVLATSPAGGSCLVGASDHAAALLERVLRTAPLLVHYKD